MWGHITGQVKKGNFEATYKTFFYIDVINFLLEMKNYIETNQ